MVLSEDRLSVTSHKGYRMVRAPILLTQASFCPLNKFFDYVPVATWCHFIITNISPYGCSCQDLTAFG